MWSFGEEATAEFASHSEGFTRMQAEGLYFHWMKTEFSALSRRRKLNFLNGTTEDSRWLLPFVYFSLFVQDHLTILNRKQQCHLVSPRLPSASHLSVYRGLIAHNSTGLCRDDDLMEKKGWSSHKQRIRAELWCAQDIILMTRTCRGSSQRLQLITNLDIMDKGVNTAKQAGGLVLWCSSVNWKPFLGTHCKRRHFQIFKNFASSLNELRGLNNPFVSPWCESDTVAAFSQRCQSCLWKPEDLAGSHAFFVSAEEEKSQKSWYNLCEASCTLQILISWDIEMRSILLVLPCVAVAGVSGRKEKRCLPPLPDWLVTAGATGTGGWWRKLICSGEMSWLSCLIKGWVVGIRRSINIECWTPASGLVQQQTTPRCTVLRLSCAAHFLPSKTSWCLKSWDRAVTWVPFHFGVWKRGKIDWPTTGSRVVCIAESWRANPRRFPRPAFHCLICCGPFKTGHSAFWFWFYRGLLLKFSALALQAFKNRIWVLLSLFQTRHVLCFTSPILRLLRWNLFCVFLQMFQPPVPPGAGPRGNPMDSNNYPPGYKTGEWGTFVWSPTVKGRVFVNVAKCDKHSRYCSLGGTPGRVLLCIRKNTANLLISLPIHVTAKSSF